MHAELRHRLPVRGRLAPGIQRAQLPQQLYRLLRTQRPAAGSATPVRRDRDAPDRELQRERRKIRAEQLRIALRLELPMLAFRPEPIAYARRFPSGSAAALIRGSADTDTVSSRAMPVRGEKRGTRLNPQSTTIRTPRTVTLDSAIEVARTILRSCSQRRRQLCPALPEAARRRAAARHCRL